MAAEGGGAGKVPKVFTERAKAAKAAMDAQLAMLEAQTKAQMTLQKAKVKQAQAKLQFTGGQLDMAAQARRDQAAASQENPVGPEVQVMPYPDASQPSQGLAGAQGSGLADILSQPGAVQGGAGIQAATGGMGRAAPQGIDPAQLQAQVSPYRVSQQTTEGAEAVQGPGGWVNMIPTSRTTTNVVPNALTPYQLGQLQLNQQKQTAAATKATLDEQTMNLAKAKRLLGMGLMGPEEFLAVRSGVLDSLEGAGLPRQLYAQVDARADAKQGEIQATEFSSYPELQKDLTLLKTQAPGSFERVKTLQRIEKLTTRAESPFAPLARAMLHPAIRESNKRYQQIKSSVVQLEEYEKLITSPGMAGIERIFTGPISEGTEMAKDVFNLFGGAVGYQKAVGSAVNKLDAIAQREIGETTNPAAAARLKQEYATMRGLLVDPAKLGAGDQLRSILAINLGSQLLDRATVLGFKSIKDELLNFTGAKSRANSLSRLRTMRAEQAQKLRNIEEERRMLREQGINLPNYDYSNYGSTLIVPEAPPEGVAGEMDIKDLLKLVPQQ